jgi:hypothetical protein
MLAYLRGTTKRTIRIMRVHLQRSRHPQFNKGEIQLNCPCSNTGIQKRQPAKVKFSDLLTQME